MPVGPVFVGYWICCPSSGVTSFYASSAFDGGVSESLKWLETRGEFQVGPVDDDDEPTMVSKTVERPETIAGKAKCQGCGGTMTLADGQVNCEPLFAAKGV